MSLLLLDDFDVRIRKSKNKQSNEQQQKLKDKQEENANFRSEHLIPFTHVTSDTSKHIIVLAFMLLKTKARW